MEYFFSEKALSDVKKLEHQVQKRIIKKLDYFIAQKDPLKFAEILINSALGQHRFRVGDYRIIFDLEEEKIIVLRIGHRRNIYK